MERLAELDRLKRDLRTSGVVEEGLSKSKVQKPSASQKSPDGAQRAKAAAPAQAEEAQEARGAHEEALRKFCAACLDEGLLELSLPILIYTENPYIGRINDSDE